MKYIVIIAFLALAGCAGVTPAGQAINQARAIAKPIIAKQLDESMDLGRTLICDDVPYVTEMRARARWNVTPKDWNGFCGRQGVSR